MRRTIFLLSLLLQAFLLQAQREPDQQFMPSIRTIKFHVFGDPLAYPIISLNSNDQLELHFDDLEGGVKTFYYTIELCNADWTPVQMSFFDYAKGFSRVRISTYRNSSIALTRYTHYTATLPDRNCQPTRSGNYLLKVFVNGDTSNLAFTRRFLVVDNRLNIAAQIQQPFSQQYFRTHHKLQVNVNPKGIDLRYPQQQLSLVILQNYRWDNSLRISNPVFVRSDLIQYNNEAEMLMPAGKEWRWVNLRSFRLLGERVSFQQNTDSSFSVFVQPETPRLANQYFYFRDINGFFINETTERVNPYWNAEYGMVHFRFRPPNGTPYPGKDLYLFGEMTAYGRAAEAKMQFNAAEGYYETRLLLKQGYYDYIYTTRDRDRPTGPYLSDETENNSWETENVYTVLVYYRELGGRYDQLLGISRVSSQFRQMVR